MITALVKGPISNLIKAVAELRQQLVEVKDDQTINSAKLVKIEHASNGNFQAIAGLVQNIAITSGAATAEEIEAIKAEKVKSDAKAEALAAAVLVKTDAAKVEQVAVDAARDNSPPRPPLRSNVPPDKDVSSHL